MYKGLYGKDLCLLRNNKWYKWEGHTKQQLYSFTDQRKCCYWGVEGITETVKSGMQV